MLFQTESVKKLLFGINERFLEYQNNLRHADPIKKLHYAIKTTLKKVQDIQEHINADEDSEAYETVGPRTQGTSETPMKIKFSDITPPERKLQFIDSSFYDLKSHSVGTPVTTKTSS